MTPQRERQGRKRKTLGENPRRNLVAKLLTPNDIMKEEYNDYGENAVDDMMVDYDYHINTGDLPELFDDSSVDDFINSLNDWD